MTTAGTGFPLASTLAWARVHVRSEKSTLPISRPIGGMMIFSTSAVTILPNAAPMTTPTARSMTLPRMANSLNSLIMPMGQLLGWGDRGRAASLACQRRHDGAAALADAVDAGIEMVTRLQRGHTGRCAHHHQVAGFEGKQL